jgi:hypothetical protein
LNPRHLSGEPLFESGALSHSATSPQLTLTNRISFYFLFLVWRVANCAFIEASLAKGFPHSLRSFERPEVAEPTSLVLGPCGPSASPLNGRGSPGESRLWRGALSHSATSPHIWNVECRRLTVVSDQSFFL